MILVLMICKTRRALSGCTDAPSRGKEKAGAKQSRGLKAEELNKTILAYPTRLYNLVEHIEGGAVKY